MDLHDWAEELETAATYAGHPPLQAIAAQLKAALEAQVWDCFTGAHAPDGTPWPARKDPGDGHPLLFRSGDMLASVLAAIAGAVVDETGFHVQHPAVAYAVFHMMGTRYMPARPFVDWDAAGDELAQLVGDAAIDGLLGNTTWLPGNPWTRDR